MITIYWYYALSVFLGFCFFINHKLASSLLLISVPLLIAFLLPTGQDYEFYQLDYETGYFSWEPPFFYTKGSLTAEPFYKVYTGFVHVLTGVNFHVFLIINFYTCFLLFASFSTFKRSRNKSMQNLFWLFLLPVIAPTIFYFSVRSSLSFFLVLCGFFLLVKGDKYKAPLLFFLAICLHSQFIPITVFLMIISFSLGKHIQNNLFSAYRYLFGYCLILVIALQFLPALTPYVAAIFSFLPSGDIATNKLHYIESAPSGFRPTSVLSLLVFPYLAFIIYKYKKKIVTLFSLSDELIWRLVFYLSVCVAFGFCINLVYFDMPHLSGRLARFSDYLSLSVLMPLSLRCVFSLRLVILIGCLFIVAGPFLYPTIYSIH